MQVIIPELFQFDFQIELPANSSNKPEIPLVRRQILSERGEIQ